MANVLRRSAAIATCAIVLGWSAPLANEPEASASGSSSSDAEPPTNETSYKEVDDPFSLTISPTRIVLKQSDGTPPPPLVVVNRGQEPVSVVVGKRGFTGQPDGSLNFQDNAPYSAADWVTIEPTSFTVPPGTSQTITTTVTVAANPEPGDHQVAIVFLVPSGETSANVKINRGIAVPVFVAVAGPTDDTVSVGELAAPGFVWSGDVDIAATLRNEGTVHRDFRGAEVLKVDIDGAAVSFPNFTVIRGATRKVTTSWDPPLMCVCHPTVSFVNAVDGSVQTATIRVIVFPLLPASIAVGVLLILILGLVLRRRRRTARERAAAPASGAEHA